MKTYLSILLVVISYQIKAQPSIQWQNFYGADFCSANLHDMQQTPDGGYVLIGDVVPETPFYGDEGFGGGDIFVIRLDSSRNIIWCKLFGGSQTESRGSILALSDGGFLFAAEAESSDDEVSFNHGSRDVWVVKLDTDGNILWDHSYGGGDEDFPSSLIATSDSNFIFAGYTKSTGGDVTGAHGTGGDAWVVKIDPSGTMIWQHALGSTYYDAAFKIKEISDGRFAMAGYCGGNSDDVTGNHGNFDCWITILNGDDGSLLQQKSFGGSDYDIGFDMIQTDDGYFILADADSDDGDLTGHYGSPSFDDTWVIKTDSALNIIWQKNYGGTGWDRPYEITATDDGNYVFVAASYSKDFDVSAHHGTSLYPDMWIAEIDGDGLLQWEKSIGGAYFDEGYKIKYLNDDGGFLLAGYAGSTNGDCSDNDYPDAAWILKLGGCNLNIHIDQPDTIIACNNQSIELSTFEDSTYDYQWYLDDGMIGTDSSSISVIGEGVYSVIVSDLNGCTDTSEVTNLFYTSIDAAITPLDDLNICETDSVELTASPGGDLLYQWFLNGDTIPGATDPDYSATVPGDYIVSVSNSFNCENTSEVITVIDSCAVGIDNLGNLSSAITIMPNPNDGNFIADVKSLHSKNLIIEIYDLFGAKVFGDYFNASNTQMYLCHLNLPGGNYIMVISDEEGMHHWNSIMAVVTDRNK